MTRASVGDSAEWGLTLEPELFEAAARVSGSLPAEGVPVSVFATVAAAAARRVPALAGAAVASVHVSVTRAVGVGETLWARVDVERVEDARVASKVTWTNQRGEQVGLGDIDMQP